MPSQKFFQNSRSRRHEQDVAVVGRVELVAHAGFHAAGARRAAFEVVGLVAGDLRLGPLVRAPRLAAQPVDRGGRVGLRDLELAALARLPRAQHAGEQSERAEHRPGVDADRHVLGHVREAVVVDLRAARCRPTRRTRCRGSACRGTGRSRRSPRSCRTRSSGLTLRSSSKPSPRRSSPPGRIASTTASASRTSSRNVVAPGVGAQVEHDALLAPADVQEQQRDAFDDRPRHAAAVVALRRLDLDDVGAEVGEVGGEVPGPEHRHFDDAQTRERSRSYRYRPSVRRTLAGRPHSVSESTRGRCLSPRRQAASGCRRCRSCRARSRRRGRVRRASASATRRGAGELSRTAGRTRRGWR